MRLLILAFTSGLGSGYAPVASGTFGTAVAVALYLPLADLNRTPSDGGMLWAYLLIVATVTGLGIWASNYAEKYYGKKDPGEVVIDEIAGFFVSMLLVPFTWGWIAAAFFVFRAFDVWKPYPIDSLQRLGGGLGIVIDDVLAGVYTCVTLHLLRLAMERFA